MSALERYAPWWGLLGVPSLFLADLSAAYALVAWACRSGTHAWVHVGPAVATLGALLGIGLSGYCVARLRASTARVAPPRYRFVAVVSLATALLFLLATLMQWYVAAALSPCLQ